MALDPAVQEGMLLFGRYGFPPNRFGYCGPADSRAVLDYVSEQHADRGLLELERQFAGALPYLRLIAFAAGIPDPFHRRVVEAYWIGNELLGRVKAQPFYDMLEHRFRPRATRHAFRWLASKLDHGARPHHNWHVFDVYTKAGTLRNTTTEITLRQMDQCRISWGRVLAVQGPSLIVERQPLVLKDDRLALGEPELVTVERQMDGRGFVEDVNVGDVVSIHWNWAAEVLTPSQLRWLQQENEHAMRVANVALVAV